MTPQDFFLNEANRVFDAYKQEHLFLAYDLKLKRPGCVLLQPLGDIANAFPNESWLLAPTDDMKTYRVTRTQLLEAVIVTMANLPESSVR